MRPSSCYPRRAPVNSRSSRATKQRLSPPKATLQRHLLGYKLRFVRGASTWERKSELESPRSLPLQPPGALFR
ncbi:hypothetical protein GW17_00060748 [Ensete ventricosum]|nr:hypothetical protein GW17_00060748 [Ensete ventricosum]